MARKNRTSHSLPGVFVLASAMLWAAPMAAARADEPAKGEAKSEGAKPPGKLKVLRLDDFTVEGRIQKPQAFFILQRSNLSFEDPDKKESFLPKIVKTCEKDPF